MKICLISNLYEPYNRGGAEQVVKNTVEGLRDRGEDVVLITARPFKGLASLLSSINVETGLKPVSTDLGNLKIYRFYPLNLFFYANDHKHSPLIRLFWHFFDIFNLHSYFIIKNILRHERPDVVHTHNLKGLGYLIPLAIKQSKIKHIHTIHDIQLASPSGLMIKGEENSWRQKCLLVKAYSTICRYLFRSVDIVISPSSWLLNYYQEKKFFLTAKKNILRNPVSDKKSIKQKIKKSDLDIVNFLFIGQVEKHKGIFLLIKAFNSLLDSQKKIHLGIVGDGSALSKARGLAGGNTSFYGKLSHQDALEHLDKADFVVVPSLCYENSPNVVLEALNAGKPVIVADIGGAAELVNDYNGFKFIAGNLEDLKSKMFLAMEKRDNFDSEKIKNSFLNVNINNYIDTLIDTYKR